MKIVKRKFPVVLHAAALLSPPSGIIQQMEWEQIAASRLNLNWIVRIFCPKDCGINTEIIQPADVTATSKGLKRLFVWIKFRHQYYRWLKSIEEDVDIYLLRYYVHDPLQLIFILRSKKPVVLVHHTLEIDELAAGRFGQIRSGLEKLLGRYSIRHCSLSVGVTGEILSYEKKRGGLGLDGGIIYPNGILIEPRELYDRREEIPELLYVAGTFAPWHGLDLLLDAVAGSGETFKLHLVGNLSADDFSVAQKDARVVIHGRKTPSEIECLASVCWIGLSSFGLFRNKMTEACTLKVREYFDLGLPVYSGHADVFPPAFKQYRQGGPDMHSILNFARECRNLTRTEVAELARPHIDKTKLLERFVEAIFRHRDRIAIRALRAQ